MVKGERLNLETTALVVFDMQKGQLDVPWRKQFLEEQDLVAKCAELIATAHAVGVDVIYVQNVRQENGRDQPDVTTDELLAGPDSAPMTNTIPPEQRWDTLDALKPQHGDFTVGKIRWGAFPYTILDSLLRTNHKDTVIMCGVRTQVGIEGSCRDGRELGYNMIAARDACGGCPQEMHDYLMDNIFPMFSRVRSVAQIAEMLGQPA
jgi:nicotinamidase-related amidase